MQRFLRNSVQWNATEPKDFEEQYKFMKQIPAEYKCLICSKLLRDPQVTECCGQHFCQYCLSQWLNGNSQKVCPHCRTVRCNYIRYLPMKREIDELQIYCSNRQEGCKAVTTMKDIPQHIKTCEFEMTTCSCGKNMLRKQIRLHKRSACPDRQVTCQYCRKREAFKNLKDHHKTCSDFPQACPRGCGASGIKRKNLDSHKQKCPLEPLQCPFSEAGCHDTVYRQDYDTHQEEYMQHHLGLLMNSFSRLSAEHNALKKSHEALRKEHNELKIRQTSVVRKSGYSSDCYYQDDDDDPGYTSTASEYQPHSRPARFRKGHTRGKIMHSGWNSGATARRTTRFQDTYHAQHSSYDRDDHYGFNHFDNPYYD